jgi:hypothetical protein
MATDIKEATSAYSMTVARELFATKFLRDMNTVLLLHRNGGQRLNLNTRACLPEAYGRMASANGEGDAMRPLVTGTSARVALYEDTWTAGLGAGCVKRLNRL